MAPGGVWEGSLYLHGGGDPTFGSQRRSSTATTAASAPACRAWPGWCARSHPPRHRLGEGRRVHFDSLRGEPSSDYAPGPFLEGTLSALAFNRGETGTERGPTPPPRSPRAQLRGALRADGVTSPAPAAPRPPGRGGAARHAPSPTIAQLIGLMLPPSDNFFAEMLVKDLGARFGGAGTTAAGRPSCRDDRLAARASTRRSLTARGSPKRTKPPPIRWRDLLVALIRRRRDGAARAWRSPGAAARSEPGCATHARPAAARARPARSPACRTWSATAPPATGTRWRSPSSPTAPDRTAHTFQDNIAITLRRRCRARRPSLVRAARAGRLRRAPHAQALRPSRAWIRGCRPRPGSRSSSTPTR